MLPFLSPAQRQLKQRAQEFAAAVIAPRAAEIDRTESYPWDVIEKMVGEKFFGMTIPQEYGGLGLGVSDAVIVIHEFAKHCGVCGRIAVEANMGAIGAIMSYGTEAQKSLAAKLVLSGDKPAICITEPDAGSAATDMTTRADRRGDTYVLNGKKHWITGGGVSKLHLIFARVFDEAGLEQGIGGFMAVRDETPSVSSGLIVGAREPTMGLRGIPETEIIMQDLMLSSSRLILPPKGLAHGFAQLMEAYNAQRVGAATVALGLAEGAYDQAISWLKKREQFGRPLYEFQGLQWLLADMSISLEAARALIWSALQSNPDGFPGALEAARAKVFASESAIKITNDALQIFGARGYSRNFSLERMARDARMFTIGGGTAQILRTMIASRILDRKFPQTRDGYTKQAVPTAG